MGIDYEKMYRNLLRELISLKKLQNQQKKLDGKIKNIKAKRNCYAEEYDRLSQIEREEKFWCRERIRNKFMLSTLIVVTIIGLLCFFGGLEICNLLKITSEILSALICFLPGILAGSVTSYFMYTKRINNDKYFRESLENNSLYQGVLKELQIKEREIKSIDKEHDGLILQNDDMLARLTQKEGIISSLIDTLELGLDDSSHSDDEVVSRNNGLVRRKVKEDK